MLVMPTHVHTTCKHSYTTGCSCRSNLISGELFGEDISNRVVANCLKVVAL